MSSSSFRSATPSLLQDRVMRVGTVLLVQTLTRQESTEENVNRVTTVLLVPISQSAASLAFTASLVEG